VLSFAAVGFHLRERLTRLALFVLLLATPVRAQTPAIFDDLCDELAKKIAGQISATDRVRIVGDDRAAVAELERLLGARTIRVADGDAPVLARLSCGEGLADRSCVVEIDKNGVRTFVSATRTRDARQMDTRPPILSLELRPVFAQRDPILDVALVGDDVLVLSPRQVAFRSASAPITTSRIWPRDLRGRLRVEGPRFEAFLPGVVCRGGLGPLTMVCADEVEAWPIGLENAGMTPGRNYFMTPEGLAFFGAAALDRRWLVADVHGSLAQLDDQRRVASRGPPADDVIGIGDLCTSGHFVIAASRAANVDDADTLTLLRDVDGTLATAAPAVTLQGLATALWVRPGDRAATVVVHDPTAHRYEAFQLTVSCTR